jgi:2-polyprenyl-6-hydroxyphenyl methylase/3-demethylubiquinone-9 3-methyltransferase
VTGESERFEFGANWSRFLAHLDEQRVAEAVSSISAMLGFSSLEGLSFLDIGSGSGLFSLAAMRLGAERVYSFDYDPQSVACTAELRRRYFPDSPTWRVEQGDATDLEYLRGLGQFNVVYSWGVLHHTGAMWTGIENACAAVAAEGRLFLAIYNDQGRASRAWLAVKKTYNRLPRPLRLPMALLFAAYFELGSMAKAVLRGDIGGWLRRRREGPGRGMSRWHDCVDWIGGYPFEVAKPSEVVDFCGRHGFEPVNIVVRDGLGCNEFVFQRESEERRADREVAWPAKVEAQSD